MLARMVSRRVACVAVIVCLVGAVDAQDDGVSLRGRAIGEVRTRENRAWVGAEVVLVSRPVPHAVHLGEEDRVVAVTDERGRFFAPVLGSRAYTAWAWGEVTDGGREATQVVDRVFAERPILLRAERRLARRSVRLANTAPWASCAPLELRVVDGTVNRQVTWLPVGEADAVELPFLVGAEAWVDVFGKGRHPILRAPLDPRRAPAVLDVELPSPTEKVVVVHAPLGTPRPGATVLSRFHGELFPATTTDAGGRAKILVVGGDTKLGVEDSVFVRAPGCGMGVSRRADSVAGLPGVRLPEAILASDHFVAVAVAPTLHVRVLGLDEVPLVGAQIWCHGAAGNNVSPQVGIYDSWHDPVRTGDDGMFTLIDPNGRSRFSAPLILRERDYQHLPARWRRGLFPVVLAPLLGQPGKGTEADPIVVRLAAMCPVALEVQGEGGTPGLDIELQLGGLVHSVMPMWGDGGDLPVDPRAGMRMLVPAGQLLALRAVHGSSMLVRAFETSRGCPDADAALATFTLPAPASISGQVLDKAGNPLVGARIFAGFGTSNTPADWQYASEPAPRIAVAERNTIRVFAPSEREQRLMLTTLVTRWVRSDKDGRFVLPMPPEAMPDLLLHVLGAGGAGIFDGDRLQWTGESQQDVVLRQRF